MIAKTIFASRAVSTLLVGLCLLCTAAAQVPPESPAPRPPIPSLKPPALSHWTISYLDREAKPASAVKAKGDDGVDPNTGFARNRRVLEEDYGIGSDVAYVNKTNTDGTVDMIYLVEGVAFIADGMTKEVHAHVLSGYSRGNVRFRDIFPGFDWVKPDFFVDEQEKDGRKFLHFLQAPTAAKKAPPKNVQLAGPDPTMFYDPSVSANEREAWIDEASNLPVAFRIGTTVGMYHFEAPINGQIALPPVINKAVRTYDGYPD